MRPFRTTALTVALMAAALPSLVSPAHAWWHGGWVGHGYPAYSGYGYAYHPVIRHHLYAYAGAHMVDPCTNLHDAWAAATDPWSRAYFYNAAWQAGCSFAASFTPWTGK